jgi:hypothetical protein
MAWIAAAVATAGCGPTPARSTSLYLTVEIASGAAPPDELRISVYGDQGALFADGRLPSIGALQPQSATTLGTVTIYLPATTGHARIDVRGLMGGLAHLEGATEADVLRDRQLPVTVTLQGAALPDADGDGVPDQIDNCPASSNAGQSDANGDGVGDACVAGDGGGPDAAADGTGRDGPGGDGQSDAAPDPAGDGAAPGGVLALAQGDLNATVNLTTEGTVDWAKWGVTLATSFDHKATGGRLIDDVVPAGSEYRYTTDTITFSWSDGTPTAASAGTTTGIYGNGTGAGFSFPVQASTAMRTLRVYVGGNGADARFTAHLSDGSAPDVTYTTTGRTGGTAYQVTMDVTFRAAAAGQTLSVSWASLSTTGSISLKAATLF